jgi:hypothetical protein
MNFVFDSRVRKGPLSPDEAKAKRLATSMALRNASKVGVRACSSQGYFCVSVCILERCHLLWCAGPLLLVPLSLLLWQYGGCVMCVMCVVHVCGACVWCMCGADFWLAGKGGGEVPAAGPWPWALQPSSPCGCCCRGP